MFEKYTIQKILSMVQAPETSKEYHYNEMPCINSKPGLQRGNENLLQYRLTLPLHYKLCNVKKSIETVEKYAESGEAFDWVYNKKYMGNFVISQIDKKLTKMFKDFYIFAELTFTVLENPNPLINAPDYNQDDLIAENSSKMQEFKKAVLNSIKDNAYSAVSNALVSDSLSDFAKTAVKNITSAVATDCMGTSVSDIYESVLDYASSIAQNSSLTPFEIAEVSKNLSALPSVMLDSALGGVFK